LISPLDSTVILIESCNILTGNCFTLAVVRNNLNSLLTSGFCKSSTNFSNVWTHDNYKWVFWYNNHAPSSLYFLNINRANLPWPCPNDNWCNDLLGSNFLPENVLKSFIGSEPGVTINIIGVSLVELLYPSSILNNGGFM